MRNVARMPQVTVEIEFRTKECRAELGDQLFRRISLIAKAFAPCRLPVKSRLVAGPMAKLMKGCRVEVMCVFEGAECRKRYEIGARRKIGFAGALPDIGVRARYEFIDGRITLIPVPARLAFRRR